MSTRNQRRRQHKRLKAALALDPVERLSASGYRLRLWRDEAYRRAESLNQPMVWALAEDSEIQQVAHALDDTGELLADLKRTCAEAINKAGGPAVQGSRPLADRGRLRRTR